MNCRYMYIRDLYNDFIVCTYLAKGLGGLNVFISCIKQKMCIIFNIKNINSIPIIAYLYLKVYINIFMNLNYL